MANSWLIQAAWQAGVLAALVWSLGAILGRWIDPRWRFVLWLVVLARLALPVVPTAPWSMFQVFAGSAATVADANPIAVRKAVDAVEQVMPQPVFEHPRPHAPSPDSVPAQSISPAGAPQPRPANWFWSNLYPLAISVWLCGVLILSVRWLRSLRQLARRRSEWQVVESGELRQLLDECRQTLGMRRKITLYVSAENVGPAVCCVWRPAIVLPQDALQKLSRDELRLVLLHEVMHVCRYDSVIDHAATLVAALHWFHPVGWLARRNLRRERELACDVAVLDALPPNAVAHYGDTLLKTAALTTAQPLLVGMAGTIQHGSVRTLSRRIEQIAAYRRRGWLATGASLGILCLLIGTGLTQAQNAVSTPETITEQASAKAASLTLRGICHDESGRPLSGVRVKLYHELRPLAEATSDRDGQFLFEEVSPPASERPHAIRIAVSAQLSGRASQVTYVSDGKEDKPIKFYLSPAKTLRGRVTDDSGKPVAGALVFTGGCHSGPIAAPWPGIHSATTDRNGNYAIHDLAALDFRPIKQPDGSAFMIDGCFAHVQHPGFATARPKYRELPATVDVRLEPASQIEGRVFDQVTGKPAAQMRVLAQGTTSEYGFSHVAVTDNAGNYRIANLPAATFNIVALSSKDRVAVAIDSLKVESGRTHRVPDLQLIEGGWLEGQVLDARTDAPIARDEFPIEVGVYDSSHPKSGAACQSAKMAKDRRFRVRVAPGKIFPYIMNPDVWQRTQRREFYEQGIEIKSGEVVSIVFRVLPEKPWKDPDPAPVRLAIPIAAERDAAQTIRDLGGWYQVDDEQHVVEVNMVYHETAAGVRYDNRQPETDAALRRMNELPRLQRVFLKGEQASDEALASLKTLSKLETLYIWDGKTITDAGILHLRPLQELRDIHLSGGELRDASLAVFASLPKLERLSLQGNHISDNGIQHLRNHASLKSLWIGQQASALSSDVAEPLSTLASLEELDLQNVTLNDEALGKLAGLSKLRMLFVSADPRARESGITDASLKPLMNLSKLEWLSIYNTHISEAGLRSLCELPKLQRLQFSSDQISSELQTELAKQYPAIRLSVVSNKPKK